MAVVCEHSWLIGVLPVSPSCGLYSRSFDWPSWKQDGLEVAASLVDSPLQIEACYSRADDLFSSLVNASDNAGC